jgi:DNA transposition AAA+ family ATPase
MTMDSKNTTASDAKKIAQQLGDLPELNPNLQSEIQRLRRKNFMELFHVQSIHQWLEDKKQSCQPGRIVGASRTGKTMACDAYRLRNKPRQMPGKPPIVPVVCIQVPEDCSAKELFGLILTELKYQIVSGTVAEIRDRTLRVMKGCGVEMLIIDEAQIMKPKTFSDVRLIFDKLEISVILIGTDELDKAVKKDPAVYNRFRPCYRLENLSGDDFKRTVEIWEKQVLKLPSPSNLSSKTMLKTLGAATGGYIGLLDMILRGAAIKALKKGLPKIDLETLKEVAAEYR